MAVAGLSFILWCFVAVRALPVERPLIDVVPTNLPFSDLIPALSQNEAPYKLIAGQVLADFTDDYLLGKVIVDSRSKSIKKRATVQSTDHVVEVFFIVDHEAYTKWLSEYNGDAAEADKHLKLFYYGIERSLNQRYSHVTKMSNSIGSLKIKSVGLMVLKDPVDSSWTDTCKLSNGLVNVTQALEKLQEWIKGRTEIPVNDHVMAFTGYNLQKDANADVKGLSTLGGMCTESSIAIIADDMTATVAAVAAHELGHSLGAAHDKEETGCSDEDNFIMTTRLKFPASDQVASRPWQFSVCSVRRFEDTLSRLSCTLDNNTQIVGNLTRGEMEEAGQIFNADKQCSMADNDGSYVSRSVHTTEGYNNMCRGMFCEIGNSSSVTIRLPLDGTSCGHKKWCQLGRCVKDQMAPFKFDNCPQGDHPLYGCHVGNCLTFSQADQSYHCCETCPVFSPIQTTVNITRPDGSRRQIGERKDLLGAANLGVPLGVSNKGGPHEATTQSTLEYPVLPSDWWTGWNRWLGRHINRANTFVRDFSRRMNIFQTDFNRRLYRASHMLSNPFNWRLNRASQGPPNNRASRGPPNNRASQGPSNNRASQGPSNNREYRRRPQTSMWMAMFM